MTAPPVSVVIVSRDRPGALTRCLTGLGQLYYHPYEVVAVADAPGRDAVAAHPLGNRVKSVAFDTANISAARNAGIAAAGGAIVAFIDDDAVPEPSWLDHLTAPIADGQAEMTGGFVLGRNGIGFQWRARVVDETGHASEVEAPGTTPFAPVPRPGDAVKTEGTNMAASRAHLAALGGFDPRFRFFLDETDLNLRSARAGGRTILVPLAQVHHGFASSPRRRADRTPLSLFDIGASAELFWNKHSDPARVAGARQALIAEQRARLDRLLVRGAAEPRDLRRLLATLTAGLDEGRARAETQAPPPDLSQPPAFFALHDTPPGREMAFLGGRGRDSARLRAEALAEVARGGRASLTLLDRGFRRHNVRFTEDGIWLQRGGRLGRSDRAERPTQQSFDDRAASEKRRVEPVRNAAYCRG